MLAHGLPLDLTSLCRWFQSLKVAAADSTGIKAHLSPALLQGYAIAPRGAWCVSAQQPLAHGLVWWLKEQDDFTRVRLGCCAAPSRRLDRVGLQFVFLGEGKWSIQGFLCVVAHGGRVNEFVYAWGDSHGVSVAHDGPGALLYKCSAQARLCTGYHACTVAHSARTLCWGKP